MLDASPAGIRSSLPPQATRKARTATPSDERRRAAAARACLIDRTPGARRASPAAGPRGSPPRRPPMSYSTRRQVAVHALVSSSSQAARGSPSRGWPTLPGFSSHSPSARSACSPPRRAVAGRRLALRARRTTARRASGRRGRRARAGRRGTARRAAAERRTPRSGRAGSRGRGRRRRLDRRGLSDAQLVEVLGVDDLLRPARGERGAARELARATSSPVTARSWLPARQTSRVLARASSTQSLGSAP